MIKPQDYGKFNTKTGKWNPSPDSYRYDSSNSATAMDFITGAVGIRRFGLGGKVPAIIRGANKVTESSYKGLRTGKAWNDKVNRYLNHRLKSVDKSRIGKLPTKRLKATNKGKAVGRFLISKKGKALTGTTIASLLGSGSTDKDEENRSKTDSETSGMFIRPRKDRRRQWLQ